MKQALFWIIVLLFPFFSQLLGQGEPEEGCRLTMVIPRDFVQAGKEEGVAKYRSKKNKTSLKLIKDRKGAEHAFFTAQAAADNTYQKLTQKPGVSDLSVVNEKIGKTDFVIVSWLEPGKRRSSNACMTAFNSDCELIYTFEMNSLSSSKKDLDKVFRKFLKTCRRSEIK